MHEILSRDDGKLHSTQFLAGLVYNTSPKTCCAFRQYLSMHAKAFFLLRVDPHVMLVRYPQAEKQPAKLIPWWSIFEWRSWQSIRVHKLNTVVDKRWSKILDMTRLSGFTPNSGKLMLNNAIQCYHEAWHKIHLTLFK